MAEDDLYEDDVDYGECGRFSLFESLARRDEQDRAPILDNLERAVRTWSEKTTNEGEECEQSRVLLRNHLWSVLALRCNAPFEDIRIRMKKLLEDTRVRKERTEGEYTYGRILC